uniref:ATPase family AAA domain containing 1 n=1 Tax=Molossus molossus TaxID=27622 RepID=A0A7J8DN60_MOLMO|nr:ATPase family AAA domain containing 1 [Molossus molossus]
MVHAEAFSRPLSRNEVVGLIFRLTIFGAVTYFTIKWMVDAIDPTRKQKVEAQKQVIVMGATNRPQDLDSAIMRRMPTRFHINQPALKQREAILKLILKNENVDRHVDLLEVAQETDGFSGSDLKEMCRDAALLCVREYVNSTSEESHDEDEIRPVQQQDLHRAIEKMKKSKDAAFQNVLTHVCLD